MFKAITEELDKLFMMEFFQQNRKVHKEKNFKKKLLAFKEFIRICDKRGIGKADKFAHIYFIKISKILDPALKKLSMAGFRFMFTNFMPKDTVPKYDKYCDELYGKY